MSQNNNNNNNNSTGINAFHIDAARNMHRLATSSRFPKPMSNTTTTRKFATVTTSNTQAQALTQSQSQPQSQIHVPAITHTGRCTNPQCESCGAVIIPGPVSHVPVIETPSLSIGKFDIITQRQPILNSGEIEIWEGQLHFPVPEMIFGNNKVEIIKRNNDDSQNLFKISFNAFDALKQVDNYLTIDTSKMVKVSYANEWYKSRQELNSTLNTEDLQQKDITSSTTTTTTNIMEMYKPFDWTYTTNFQGSCNLPFIKGDEYLIPIDRLSRPDPILLYDDMILYEDELGDNGMSILSIKIRVMKDSLLVLQRLFVRVDQVLVRNYETRVFIDFDQSLVIRESKKQEMSYEEVLKKLPSLLVDPNKYLRDINYLVKIMPVLSKSNEYLIIPDDK